MNRLLTGTLVLAVLMVGGCMAQLTGSARAQAVSAEEGRGPDAELADTAAVVRPNGLPALLAYFESLRQLSPAELQRERARLAQRAAHDGGGDYALRRALLQLAERNGAGNRRAAGILSEHLARDDLDAEQRGLAVLLLHTVNHNASCEDRLREQQLRVQELQLNITALEDRLIEAQLAAAALQQKLDALTTIETSINQREALQDLHEP
jgi:hypothetical protein